MDPPVLRHQREFNRATRDAWDAFAPHRARVMDAVLDRPGGRLLVLGAGNCNDLDLSVLVARFDEVHLADLDAASVRSGVERQNLPADAVQVHDSIDVTGIVGHLDAFWQRAPDDTSIEAAIRAATEAPTPPLAVPFDAVLSAAVLTQLIDSVAQSAGGGNPNTRRLADAVRNRHVRLLDDLTTPGGRAVLVTDMLSTDRYPPLASITPDELTSFFDACVRENRCFAGTSPAELEALIASRASAIRRTAPWVWQIGPLGLLAYALLIDLSSTEDEGR